MGMESPKRGGVHVAAFGKHPGWDDHIEDIGLDHALLVDAKRVLYTEGMAGNIDSGAWERLPEDQRLPAFRHVFYWKRGDLFLVGRMWSSRDGKGRSKYPMCVVAMVEGAPMAWVISRALTRLAEVESKVTQTNSAELVRLAIGEARRALDDEARLAGATGFDIGAPQDADLLRRLVEHPRMSAADGPSEGLTRILYEIEREMGLFRPASGSTRLSRTQVEGATAAHIRVPKCLGEGGEAARAWLTLMREELADEATVLVVEPLGQDYLDVIVGEPKANHLFCVRASGSGLAPASEVPYTIESSFVAEAASRVGRWRQGVLARRPTTKAAGGPGAPGGKRARLIIAGVGVAALIIALLGLRLLSGSRETPAVPETPERPTPTTPDQAELPAEPAPPQPIATNGGGVPQANGRDGDPRAGWDFDERLSRARGVLAEMAREFEAEGRGNGSEFSRRLDRAEEKVRKFIRTATYAPKDRERLIADMREVEREVGEVEAEARSRLTDVHGRIRAWLEEQATQPPVANGAARSAWATAVRSVDATKGWAATKRRMEELSRALPAVEQAIAAALGDPLPALVEANSGAVAQMVAAKREEALRAGVDAVVADDAAKVATVSAELRAWGERARRMLSKAAEIEELLVAGCRHDEEVGGRTISGLFSQLQGEEAWGEFSVALGPLSQRCEGLRILAGEKDARRLLDALRQAREDQSRLRASEAMTAWKALDDAGWPVARDDLRDAARTLTEDLAPVIARLRDSTRRETLTNAAQEAARRMWGRWASANATDDASIDALVQTGTAMGVRESDHAALPAWVRYNLARHALKKAVEEAGGKSGAARDSAQRAAMDAFVRAVQSLEVAGEPAPRGLLDAIEPLRRMGAELDIAKLGPGSVGWKLAEGSDGEHVAYILEHEGREWRLEFRRVEPPESERVSYLGTTEVSVGQFAAIVSKAGRWEEFSSKPEPSFLPPPPDPAGRDPRAGARAWVWSDGKIEPAKAVEGDTSAGWLRARPSMSGKPYYPEGLAVSPPTWDSPMQQIGPVAAALAAKLAGCRLPTSAEWRAAAQSSATDHANLRDASWKRVYDHIRSLGVPEAEYPGSAVFRPASAPTVTSSADNTPAVTTDDGVVWFVPAGQGGGQVFHHLVGNVAEFVFEDPGSMEAAPATRDDVKAVIGQGDKVAVIGASALSPPDVKFDEAYALWPRGPRTFSDVGFRLAYSAPREASAAGVGQRLQAALEQHGYLTGAK